MLYLILLPHIPALDIASLTQTAGHKMVALAAVFFCVQLLTF